MKYEYFRRANNNLEKRKGIYRYFDDIQLSVDISDLINSETKSNTLPISSALEAYYNCCLETLQYVIEAFKMEAVFLNWLKKEAKRHIRENDNYKSIIDFTEEMKLDQADNFYSLFTFTKIGIQQAIKKRKYMFYKPRWYKPMKGLIKNAGWWNIPKSVGMNIM